VVCSITELGSRSLREHVNDQLPGKDTKTFGNFQAKIRGQSGSRLKTESIFIMENIDMFPEACLNENVGGLLKT
jgi:hypothetical protein